MALILTTSGAYLGVYTAPVPGSSGGAAGVIGITRDGFNLAWTVHDRAVRRTTSFGSTLVESIYMGADWQLRMLMLEYVFSGHRQVAWPWGTVGALVPVPIEFPVRMGRVGRRGTDNAGVLALTQSSAVSGSALSPLTFTANFAILKPGSQSGWAFDSKLRTTPVVMDLLPYDSGNTQFDGMEGEVVFNGDNLEAEAEAWENYYDDDGEPAVDTETFTLPTSGAEHVWFTTT